MITELKFSAAVKKPVSTNHVFVVDVSGSMYNELPKIRAHLKDNLKKLLNKSDTLSIIYFSSKGQYGYVCENQSVESIDVINSHIDKFLKPMGLTGFVEPLKLALEVATNAKNNNINNLIFMTDGYDNQWAPKEILSVCTTLKDAFEYTTILEYGWYCNRELLDEMNSIFAGTHKFVENYDKYEEEFESSMSNISPKKVIQVESEYIIYVDSQAKSVNVVKVENGEVRIPDYIENVIALNSDFDVDQLSTINDVTTLLQIAYFAFTINNIELTLKVLNTIKDIYLFNKFSTCFTKQDYSNFNELLVNYIFDENIRFQCGKSTTDLIPDDDAYTISDLLEDLVRFDVQLDISSDSFNYNRIGKTVIQKTVEDKQKTYMDEYAKASPERKEELLELMKTTINSWTPKFTDTSSGVIPINRIVLNEVRPNISIGTTKTGYIEIPDYISAKYKSLPKKIESIQHRTYNIIKDGIVNTRFLPIIGLSSDLIEVFNKKANVPNLIKISNGECIVDLLALPLINRNMVKTINSVGLAKAALKLEKLRALQKVCKFKIDNYYSHASEKLAELYGTETAEFLASVGIKDYGFSPLSKHAESTDFYMSKEFHIKISGLSSIPSVNAVLTKIDEGKKLNLGDYLIKAALDRVNKLSNDDLKILADFVIGEVRSVTKEISKTMYSIILGHAWFNDIPRDQTEIELDVSSIVPDFGSKPVKVKFDILEKQIKI